MNLRARAFLHMSCDNSNFLKLTIKDLYAFSRSESLTRDLQCIMTSFRLIKIKAIWETVAEDPWYKPHLHSLIFDYSYEIKERQKSKFFITNIAHHLKKNTNCTKCKLQLLRLFKLHLCKKKKLISHRDLKIRVCSGICQVFCSVFNQVLLL